MKISLVVLALLVGWAKAWTAGDAEAWSEHLADDIDFTVWTGMYVKGRSGVTEGHKQIFSSLYKDTKQKLDVRSIRFLRDDIAVAHIEGSVVKTGEPFPEKPQVAPLAIFTKQGGEWKAAVFQNLLRLEAAKERICEAGD